MWKYLVIISLILFLGCMTVSAAQSQDEGNPRARLIQLFGNYTIYIRAYPNRQFCTGIIFRSDTASEAGGCTIVSNKHLLIGADSIQVLLQLTDEHKNSIDTITKNYQLYSESKDSLFCVHDSLDIATLYVNHIKGRPGQQLSIFTIKQINVIKPNEVFQGQSVLFFGYPKDIKLNGYRPIVRQGIIAGYDQAPRLPGMKHVIYLDAQVYGGSSGSPVFINPVERIKGLEFFVGIIAGYIYEEKGRVLGLKVGDTISLTENTGLGIVMPADEIAVLSDRARKRYEQHKSK